MRRSVKNEVYVRQGRLVRLLECAARPKSQLTGKMAGNRFAYKNGTALRKGGHQRLVGQRGQRVIQWPNAGGFVNVASGSAAGLGPHVIVPTTARRERIPHQPEFQAMLEASGWSTTPLDSRAARGPEGNPYRP
jgi:hypothetical protein